MKQNQGEKYSTQETERRHKAALQGAFNTPAKPLKTMTQKRPKAQPVTAKKKLSK
jgi:hypothetical protein